MRFLRLDSELGSGQSCSRLNCDDHTGCPAVSLRSPLLCPWWCAWSTQTFCSLITWLGWRLRVCRACAHLSHRGWGRSDHTTSCCQDRAAQLEIHHQLRVGWRQGAHPGVCEAGHTFGPCELCSCHAWGIGFCLAASPTAVVPPLPDGSLLPCITPASKEGWEADTVNRSLPVIISNLEICL